MRRRTRIRGSGDEILYFALERNANTGTANVAFWFLQDDNVNCVSPGGSTPFTGDHTDGDILVVSEFTNGGVVNTIQAYRWDGGPNGVLNPDPIAAGVDCGTTAGDDTLCGKVNTRHDHHSVADVEQAGRPRSPRSGSRSSSRAGSTSRPPSSTADASTCSWLTRGPQHR